VEETSQIVSQIVKDKILLLNDADDDDDRMVKGAWSRETHSIAISCRNSFSSSDIPKTSEGDDDDDDSLLPYRIGFLSTRVWNHAVGRMLIGTLREIRNSIDLANSEEEEEVGDEQLSEEMKLDFRSLEIVLIDATDNSNSKKGDTSRAVMWSLVDEVVPMSFSTGDLKAVALEVCTRVCVHQCLCLSVCLSVLAYKQSSFYA
jgi:hypothetical protein